MSVRSILRAAKRAAYRVIGYDDRNWLRVRQIEAFKRFIVSSDIKRAVEISPGWSARWSDLLAGRYEALHFPEFDICKDRRDAQADLVIADQVLEHVPRPLDALRNIHAMLAPGGHALIATPFLFRVHARPFDFSRWTKDGLAELLVEAGFDRDDVQTFAWGNKACVRAHISGPVRDYGLWRDMSNDDEYPIMVWAIARR